MLITWDCTCLTVRHYSRVMCVQVVYLLHVIFLFINRLSYKMSLITLRDVDFLKDWRTGWRHCWVLRLWLLLIIILLVKSVFEKHPGYVNCIAWCRCFSTVSLTMYLSHKKMFIIEFCKIVYKLWELEETMFRCVQWPK